MQQVTLMALAHNNKSLDPTCPVSLGRETNADDMYEPKMRQNMVQPFVYAFVNLLNQIIVLLPK